MNLKYTIIVNSCDNFEDCWNPFFTLFKKQEIRGYIAEDSREQKEPKIASR